MSWRKIKWWYNLKLFLYTQTYYSLLPLRFITIYLNNPNILMHVGIYITQWFLIIKIFILYWHHRVLAIKIDMLAVIIMNSLYVDWVLKELNLCASDCWTLWTGRSFKKVIDVWSKLTLLLIDGIMKVKKIDFVSRPLKIKIHRLSRN